MSILQRIRNFNLFCWAFGCSDKVVKPIFSLRAFKEQGANLQVGARCECKNCGKESVSYFNKSL